MRVGRRPRQRRAPYGVLVFEKVERIVGCDNDAWVVVELLEYIQPALSGLAGESMPCRVRETQHDDLAGIDQVNALPRGKAAHDHVEGVDGLHDLLWRHDHSALYVRVARPRPHLALVLTEAELRKALSNVGHAVAVVDNAQGRDVAGRHAKVQPERAERLHLGRHVRIEHQKLEGADVHVLGHNLGDAVDRARAEKAHVQSRDGAWIPFHCRLLAG
mmetsp:Transcript_11938/g.38231  ORF Transcript_11938/g.38231 Transcript_11938/m.38231 type:complete len:217 (-) Transcript_11938:695-1345(-)